MRKDATALYDYYIVREYRKGDNANYYQYRITSPTGTNKIISYDARWELTCKLTEKGGHAVDCYTIHKGYRHIDVTVYKLPKNGGKTYGK